MSERIQPVTFVNAQGLRLVGMFHQPEREARRDLAVILLSPGVKTRVAPHRLYNKLAASLTARGFCVLRFDFYGLGDAEGELGIRLLRDLYGSVGVGRYVEDTRAAIAWLTKTYGFDRVIVGGLCGGALTGLLAAPGEPRVAGVLALGLPVLLDSADVDPRQFMTVGQLTNLRGRYLRKLVAPLGLAPVPQLPQRLSPRHQGPRHGVQAAPRRQARAGADSRRRSSPPASPGSAPARTPAPGAVASNVNPHFAPAFFRTLDQGCPVLALFSEADRLFWEFEEKFLAVHRAAFDRHAPLVDLHVIKSANHVLTFEAWQDEAQDRIGLWLDHRFSRTATSPGGATHAIPAPARA